MIERYLVIKERVRRELHEIERVVTRVERALVSAQRNAEDADLYVDSIALNLHDFVVRHVYAFEFDPPRIYALAHKLRSTWEQVRTDLSTFASSLEDLSRSA